MDTASFTRVKRPGRGADHPPLSSAGTDIGGAVPLRPFCAYFACDATPLPLPLRYYHWKIFLSRVDSPCPVCSVFAPKLLLFRDQQHFTLALETDDNRLASNSSRTTITSTGFNCEIFRYVNLFSDLTRVWFI